MISALLVSLAASAVVHQRVLQTELAAPASEFESYTVQFAKSYATTVRSHRAFICIL